MGAVARNAVGVQCGMRMGVRAITTVTPQVEKLSPEVLAAETAAKEKFFLTKITKDEIAKYSAFNARSGVEFREPRNLVLATTLYTTGEGAAAEEIACRKEQDRLAALGIALIQGQSTIEIYKKFPNLTSVEIASMARAYSSQFTLRNVGRLFGLHEVLRDTKGVSISKRNADLATGVLPNIAAAFVGAVYVDQGEQAVNKFISQHILSRDVDKQAHVIFSDDFVGQLQKITKFLGHQQKPVARIIQETGRFSKNPVFLVGVFCGDVELGRSYGGSIKMATHLAYKAAIQNYRLSRTL